MKSEVTNCLNINIKKLLEPILINYIQSRSLCNTRTSMSTWNLDLKFAAIVALCLLHNVFVPFGYSFHLSPSPMINPLS